MNKFSNIEHSLRTNIAIVEKSGMSMPVTLLVAGAIIKATISPTETDLKQRQEVIDNVSDQLFPSAEGQIMIMEFKALASQESRRIMSAMTGLTEDELDASEALPQGEKLFWDDSFALTNATILFTGKLSYEVPRLRLRFDAVDGII